MEFLAQYNLTGIVIGIATFLIIGIFHPMVTKGEYYFGVKIWWLFLVMGIAAVAYVVMMLGSLGVPPAAEVERMGGLSGRFGAARRGSLVDSARRAGV